MNILFRLFSNPFAWLIDTGGRSRRQCSLLFAAALAWMPLGAAAAVITAHTTLISGSQWTASYVVSAQGSDPVIDEFSIYFSPTLYDHLTLVGAPAGWDVILIAPDAGIPADGFIDALALVSGIQPGDSQAGFTVSFNYLGSGVPPAQRFELIHPISFDIIGRGMTTSPGVAVPVPGTLPLLSLAFAVIVFVRRRSRPCATASSRS